jgi:eukaryotic-like serine/threonine-protein kinase
VATGRRRYLRQFGDPHFTTPPFLESCQVNIYTGGDRSTHLQVILHRPEPTYSPGTTFRQVGDLRIYSERLRDVAGTEGCQNWLVPIHDQPRLRIVSFTYGDEIDKMCDVTQVVTSFAVRKIEQDGIEYRADRTSSYSLASSDACALLDPTMIEKVPDLAPDIPDPGFANWSCSWGTRDEGNRIRLRFELRKRESLDGFIGPTVVAGKEWYSQRDTENNSCNVYVLHRPGVVATDTAEVLFVAMIGQSLDEDQRCKLADDLATAASRRLPS